MNLGEINYLTHSNKTKCVFVDNKELPLISIDIWCKAGSSFENVNKNGDYTPKEDGVEAYTVKMAARFHGHWILRKRTLAKTENTTERTEQLAAFATTQVQHAEDIIRTYPLHIQAYIHKQVQLYLKKDREYGPRNE